MTACYENILRRIPPSLAGPDDDPLFNQEWGPVTELEKIDAPSLTALIGGVSKPFATIEEKFEALAEAWNDHNSGRSVVDYYHLSHLQIIGMGTPILGMALERLLGGDGRWVFSLKCISGEEADAPSMRGDLDAVMNAWHEWGKRNGKI